MIVAFPHDLSIPYPAVQDKRGASPMHMKKQIESKLSAAFDPESLTVTDDSEAHRGHGGWRPGGETHFSVEMVSKAFEGKPRLERQRLVHAILAQELAGPVHALSLKLHSPTEAAAGD